MPDSAFDPFLSEVARALGQRPEQSAAVTDELRDHLEERLAELLKRGVPRESAVQTAIDELGNAATLAAEFNTVSRDLRRRWIMRYATATVAAAVLVLLVTAAFWPNTPGVPLAPQATAQEGTPPKETPAPKPKADSKEAANARTEQLLSSHRINADIKEMPLKKFFAESLGELKTGDGKTIDLQAFIDTKKLEEANVPLDTPITFQMASIRLDMLLKLVLERQLGLGYYIDDGIIIVTTRDTLDTHMEVRVYNCRDLLQLPRMKRPAGTKPAAGGPGDAGPADAAGGGALGGGVGGAGGFGAGALGGIGGGPALGGYDVELIDVLRTNVKPDSWSASGGPGDIAEYRGMLVVTQTPEVHRKIEELLEMLRLSVAKEPPATR